MAHLGSKGRELVSAALKLSLRKCIHVFFSTSLCQCLVSLRFLLLSSSFLANYPEYLDRCVLINTPWVFNTFWYFVKALIDEV